MYCFHPCGLLETDYLTIGGEAVSIVGIVVVQSTVRVDKAHIVGVARVRSPLPPIRRNSLVNSDYPLLCMRTAVKPVATVSYTAPCPISSML